MKRLVTSRPDHGAALPARRLLLAVLVLAGAALAAEPVTIPIPGGDFEADTGGWNIVPGRGDCRIVEADGGHVLRLAGDRATGGAKVESPIVPCPAPGVIELHGRCRALSGRHLGLWIREYDADGQLLPTYTHNFGELGGQDGRWHLLLRQIVLDPRATALQLFFLGYPGEEERIEVYVDDLTFVRVPLRIPPWPGQYKLAPGDPRLTPADVVGPDGIVYPNWRQVGVRGGIPDVPVALRLAELGATPGTDIAPVLQQAVDTVGKRGGGAVLIGEGEFYLDRPVAIRHDGVVVRGSGRDRTRLVFRYGARPADAPVWFYAPRDDGATIGPASRLEIHALHPRLARLSLAVGDVQVKSRPMDGRGGYALPVSGSELLAAVPAGAVTLRATATYADGTAFTAERRVVLDPAARPPVDSPGRAAFYILGNGLEEREYPLAADGKRGDTQLTLKAVDGLAVGDRFCLHAPLTDRFCDLIQDRSPRGWNRVGYYEIRAIDGTRLTINQPLRIDFPVVDGTYLRRLRPVERCGVEDLAIEHTAPLPLDSVSFCWAWNCWARGLRVRQTGRNGAYAEHSKWVEIRDSELLGAWNNDGGQAYAGFTRSADCLFTGCRVVDYRHGPVVQFGADGCVFRNSTFIGSDIQWHAGWSTENLMEACTVDSRRGKGSYGYGMYATGSDDTTHGPNGPRNVVYGCTVASQLAGGMLHGVNENWLLVYNRFEAAKGAGLVLSRGSFDHIVRGNTFILHDPDSPMVLVRTPDCVGVDLVGNTLVGGNGALWSGPAGPAADTGNRHLPATAAPPPPAPPVDSIYLWQQSHP